MIQNKTFDNLIELNDFVEKEKVQIISIETQKETYDTGLPTIRGASFKTEREVFKLWYKEVGERTINVFDGKDVITVKQMRDE